MREMTVGTWLDPGQGRKGQASPGTWSSNHAWKAVKGKGARIDTCGAGLQAECTDAQNSFYTDLLGTYYVLHGDRSILYAVGKAALALGRSAVLERRAVNKLSSLMGFPLILQIQGRGDPKAS